MTFILPTHRRKKIEIDLKRLEDLASQGLKQGEIAKNLGLRREYLNKRINNSQSVGEAYYRGLAKLAAEKMNARAGRN